MMGGSVPLDFPQAWYQTPDGLGGHVDLDGPDDCGPDGLDDPDILGCPSIMEAPEPYGMLIPYEKEDSQGCTNVEYDEQPDVSALHSLASLESLKIREGSATEEESTTKTIKKRKGPGRPKGSKNKKKKVKPMDLNDTVEGSSGSRGRNEDQTGKDRKNQREQLRRKQQSEKFDTLKVQSVRAVKYYHPDAEPEKKETETKDEPKSEKNKPMDKTSVLSWAIDMIEHHQGEIPKMLDTIAEQREAADRNIAALVQENKAKDEKIRALVEEIAKLRRASKQERAQKPKKKN
mmetsp:Transcript_9647/g.11587  ORF Transcript_9647/g.11587 Transcript_9647/m.11587 type:complete len:290 (-) Transcript_9647:89-958(-)|eukprot:CAMPEP_0184043124 /NCGR_PEP_ID=MMETSP0955-20130417/66749_1 /TAXON_ID=627963 /ORGANISM="Aplanochytrium sp, Strain PBS07" /LENGTH=289 /DNA_ID=CAMNT_0026334001 /DNA_START=98 /DNA_END=967 /DNA_ORIENTATION=+